MGIDGHFLLMNVGLTTIKAGSTLSMIILLNFASASILTVNSIIKQFAYVVNYSIK